MTEVTGPPLDSRRFPSSFIRGIKGLTARLRREWQQGTYYVGEWHFHPRGSPTPSDTDRKQIEAFAADPDLRCPLPVLIVLGGDPKSKWSLTVGVMSGNRLVALAKHA